MNPGSKKPMPHPDTIISEIQEAVNATLGTTGPYPEQAEFLKYFQDDLPDLILQNIDTSGTFSDFKDVPSNFENCKTLYVGEKNITVNARLQQCSSFPHPKYKYQTQSVKKVAYIVFCSPTINDIWGVVRNCAVGAAVAAVTAAILAEQYTLAKATFYPVFYACLVSAIGHLADQVSVDMRCDTEPGSWIPPC